MDELKKKGTTILMVTHDLGSVMKYCDRVILFNKGKKVGEGLPGEMVDQYKKILAGKNPDAEKFVEEQDFLGEGWENRREEASGTQESGKRQEGAPLSERERALSSGEEESGTTSSAPRLMKEEWQSILPHSFMETAKRKYMISVFLTMKESSAISL